MKHCRYNKTIKNDKSSSEIKGIIKKNLQEHHKEFNHTFVKENGKDNGKIWKEKKQEMNQDGSTEVAKSSTEVTFFSSA